MALLFMLICVLVSTVLLAAAGTASRDVSRQREQQQAYLAVSSAVNFLKNDICNCKFLKEQAQIVAVNDDPDTQEKMAFIELLRTALQNDRETPYTTGFDLSFSVDELKKLTVHVSFSMDKTCAITAACAAYKDTGNTESAEDTGEQAYGMTARFTPEIVEGSSDDITWVLSSVSKGSR